MWFVLVLISLCLIQSLTIVYLVSRQNQHNHDQHGPSSKMQQLSDRYIGGRTTCPVCSLCAATQSVAVPAVGSKGGTGGTAGTGGIAGTAGNAGTGGTGVIGGVAVTLMLHSPTWFQRRYSMMIQNILNNIPANWKVQVFHTGAGQSQHGLDINPAIQRFVDTGRVVLTRIPDSVLKVKKKRFELMFEPWLWQNMLAEKVLTFGGTSVICSNSPWILGNFTQFDYLGAPWGSKKGVGGDGGISVRSRGAMLAALEYKMDQVDAAERAGAFRKWGQEDIFYVSTLTEMQEKGVIDVKIATREDTLRFAAADGTHNDNVFAVTGNLGRITFDQRQNFLNLCPEIKMFFPSLHEPTCFGAHPDAAACGKTICALRSKVERKGGC
ncbi:hypothetical protein B484DRAFT_397830 [Ochromonadaceae sp. CCMP2298]|nr:hypothetical protein B484DRAFT_397830 [Ochromonadaceae sp. CCMP2298]